MDTDQTQAQQDRQQRNRLIVLGVLLAILLCVLLVPTRHLSAWWNADGAGEVTDTTAFNVSDGVGHRESALSPFRTNADRLFALDNVADPTGLEGIVVADDATQETQDLITLIASIDVGGDPDNGALGNGAFGAAALGDGAFGGRATEGAAWPGGTFFAGGSAWGFGGSGSSAAQSQSEPRQSRAGHTLRTDLGDNGSGLDTLGSGSSDNGNTSGSGDPGSSGGGSGDGIVFVPSPGDQGPTDGGVSVSVYPSGPEGGTILSDPSVDPPAGSGPGGVSISAVDPTPVPEPATLLLLGSGLFITGYRLNRRRPS